LWSFSAVANVLGTLGKPKVSVRDFWVVRDPKSLASNRDLPAFWTALVNTYLFKPLF
jgi:hypothetical protein